MDPVRMSKVHMLRSFVNQRLTAAAEEIFGLFERTMAEYEEEIYRLKGTQLKRLEPVYEYGLNRPDIQQLTVGQEVLPGQQERSSSLKQVIPAEAAHIKEEQLWSCQEREPLQEPEEADMSMFMFPPVPVKREEDEEKPQSSRHLQTQTKQTGTEGDLEHCGGSGTVRLIYPHTHSQASTQDNASHHDGSDTDDSGDWKGSDERQEGVNPLRNKDRAVSDAACNTGYSGQRKPQQHKSIQTGERPFRCSVCGKTYPGKRNLQQHMLRHSVIKPFSCSFCDRKFHSRADMERHMRVHTGEKPYSCKVCGKKFTLHGNLRQHSIIHTGEKRFTCNICDRSFSWLLSFKNHVCL